ncbi:MAG: hypothetical protein A3F73_11525 [Gallionellales bacterium RIFCSPLOWO2_12_FULL_59_22]|nr:MAG: hypothetical protein A3H99_07515 [Gallionellales bacterium RIFCSPLOWO2_02_FULL_59_110]OGT02811.1 MAG: hypothetical protein A2Z65_09630 [Gallionellales bacterium RIFCSPLOWO2_02_58_13]OGT14810.1 MAG: hypothetical protein A3F73_11525 [Gallionellales bacterium RIFCSPLOWO2_12_FULL_59_22]
MSRIAALHPELFHYTTAAGLAGILKDKSLWATHSSCVNDEEEIFGFYDRILPSILRPILPQISDSDFKKIISGFKVAASLWHDYYITSFATTDDKLVSENGLLSQWRAYGSDGGYAIALDTAALDDVLRKEGESYPEIEYHLGNVQYRLNDNRRTDDQDTDGMIENLEKAFKEFVGSEKKKGAADLAKWLTTLSLFFKHNGFEEEKEVRLVLAQLGPGLESESELQSVKQHPVCTRARNGEIVPYVELSVREINNVRQHLPIKRIIVGPHRDKHDRKRAVQLLLKQHGLNPDIVTISDIPYRGW